MTGRPCERCQGSGTEPGPAELAWRDLLRVINRMQFGDARDGIREAAQRYQEAAGSRICELERLADEILGRLGDGSHGGDCTIMQVPVAEVEAWRERRAG